MISIVIPTYEQRGKGAFFLTQLLESIKRQVINVPFEVVISDNSKDESIFKIAEKYAAYFTINYTVNPVRGASENINHAIDMARYDIIKIMCQDDLFTSPYALLEFYNLLQIKGVGWVISNSVHINEAGQRTGRRVASYQHNNFESNTVGMPSVIAFRKCDIRFDTRLKTFCDLYFYHQLYELYGPPAVIQTETVAQRFHNASQSRNQPGSHKQDRQLLVREGKIPGHLPKVVVAVVVYDRKQNIEKWINLWQRCNTTGAELVFIMNMDAPGFREFEFEPNYNIKMIHRPNIGYDIGALQDVCRNRLPGFPDYDYLLWCTDDTIPMDPNFIWHFVDPFDNSVGCTCMHISREVTYHIRTTGFCIPKRVAERLKFPADPVTTKEQCLQFEHKGANRTMFKQILAMRLKALQVTANFEHAPVYDMGFWYRNAEAKKVAHLHDRMQEHYKIFPILSNEKVTT